MRSAILAGLLFTGNLLAAPAAGEPADPVVKAWSLAFENDVFALTDKTDRWYTNGVHIAWHYGPDVRFGRYTEQFGRWLLGLKDCRGTAPSDEAFDETRCRVTVTHGIGQSIYTPAMIEEPAAQLEDCWRS